MQLEAPANRPLVHPRTSLRASRSLEQLRCLHLAHSCKPSLDKSASKKVVTKLFILGAEPLSSVPVWAEPSQLLIGMWAGTISFRTIRSIELHILVAFVQQMKNAAGI